MNKLKWTYDRDSREWYVVESVPYADDGFNIRKQNGTYDLTDDHGFRCIGQFKLLRSAKQVAHLLRFG